MANLNYNRVIIAGRLTHFPELKTTANGKFVTSFQIAYNRPRKAGDGEKADFFRVTAWEKTAEFVAKHFRRGSCIQIEGTLQTREWQGRDGKTNKEVEILANQVYIVDSLIETPPAAQTPANATCNSPSGDPAGVGYPQTGGNYTEIGNDEDLPF